MADIKTFSPKKGEKLWMMFGGKPVEATVVKEPSKFGSGQQCYDWEVVIPKHPGHEYATLYNVFRTREECLKDWIQHEQDGIKTCQDGIKYYQESIKRHKKFIAKWEKMLKEKSDG